MPSKLLFFFFFKNDVFPKQLFQIKVYETKNETSVVIY